MFWRLGGQFVVGGGLVGASPGYPPKKQKYICVLYAYVVLMSY